VNGYNKAGIMCPGITPRNAASVILVRDADHPRLGVEVLMVQRHVKSDFAPAAHVFPGGAADDMDCAPQMQELCFGLTAKQAQDILKDTPYPEVALGIFVAAVREAFEEVHILLAYNEVHNVPTFGKENEKRFAEYRFQIEKKHLSFSKMLEIEHLKAATDRLSYFAHWITPEFAPRRYDTRFFVAPAPPYQEAIPDMEETTASLWLTPNKAMEKHQQNELLLLPPTISNLEILAGFASVEEVMVYSRSKKEIPTIIPKLVIRDGKTELENTIR